MGRYNYDDVHEEIIRLYPDITDEDHLELLTRNYIFKKKLKPIGIMVLVALVCVIGFGIYPDVLFGAIDDLFKGLLLGTSSITMIICAFRFAAVLHNPLTPREERELRERKARENADHD